MKRLPTLKEILGEAVVTTPLSQTVNQSVVELQKRYQMIKNSQTPYVFIQGILNAVEQGKMLERALQQGNTVQSLLPMLQKYSAALDKVVDTTESRAFGKESSLSQLVDRLDQLIKLPQ
jgi:hypothetical protein